MYIVNGLAESIGGALAKFSDIKRATSVGETSCMMMNNHHRRVMPARRACGIQPATFGASRASTASCFRYAQGYAETQYHICASGSVSRFTSSLLRLAGNEISGSIGAWIASHENAPVLSSPAMHQCD